ncbi:ACP S-malonyltransferase [Streptomyces sp. NPDC048057]|uniref:ACP S-malonyltransferase n=1 Tax=Streptomyces sp. NPDC048057 TaxID=3155628 RepID=UPI0033E2227B
MTTTPAGSATAVVFPGMAPSNHAAVGGFMATDPHARRRLRGADDVLGYRLLDRFRDDGDRGEYTQLAFFVNCLALADRATDVLGLTADICVGPSFGQLAAAAHTGAVTFEDAVLMVARMARCEERYFSQQHGELVTRFFFRTPSEALRGVLRKREERGQWFDMSCFFGDGFYAITLAASDVMDFDKAVLAAGGVPLYSIRPAIHCRAFGELREHMAGVLHDFTFRPACVPVVSDHDGSVVQDAEAVRKLVLDGYVKPVDWRKVVATLRRRGVRKVWVPGPSNVFDRLARTHFDVVTVAPSVERSSNNPFLTAR